MVEKLAKEKTKEKPKPEARELKFPLRGKINKYGFLHFSADLLAELLGKPWRMKEADISVTIERTEGGVIVKIP